MLIRIALSLVGAGVLYTLWMALAIPGARLSQPGLGAVLFVLAPLFTAIGFALGLLLGERATHRESSGFLHAWIWPLAGCVIGAAIVFPFGPMLIVFGMFAFGTAAVVAREFASRRGVCVNPIFRPVCEEDIGALVELSLLAWAPVFDSFEQILGPDIFGAIWPDWRKSQPDEVDALCRGGEEIHVRAAEVDGKVVGFIAWELHAQSETAEVQKLAVHPDYQNEGIGTRLNELALRELKQAGVKLVGLGAGGDPSHAPARRSYEKAGYTGLPLVRYYKKL